MTHRRRHRNRGQGDRGGSAPTPPPCRLCRQRCRRRTSRRRHHPIQNRQCRRPWWHGLNSRSSGAFTGNADTMAPAAARSESCERSSAIATPISTSPERLPRAPSADGRRNETVSCGQGSECLRSAQSASLEPVGRATFPEDKLDQAWRLRRPKITARSAQHSLTRSAMREGQSTEASAITAPLTADIAPEIDSLNARRPAAVTSARARCQSYAYRRSRRIAIVNPDDVRQQMPAVPCGLSRRTRLRFAVGTAGTRSTRQPATP